MASTAKLTPPMIHAMYRAAGVDWQHCPRGASGTVTGTWVALIDRGMVDTQDDEGGHRLTDTGRLWCLRNISLSLLGARFRCVVVDCSTIVAFDDDGPRERCWKHESEHATLSLDHYGHGHAYTIEAAAGCTINADAIETQQHARADVAASLGGDPRLMPGVLVTLAGARDRRVIGVVRAHLQTAGEIAVDIDGQPHAFTARELDVIQCQHCDAPAVAWEIDVEAMEHGAGLHPSDERAPMPLCTRHARATSVESQKKSGNVVRTPARPEHGMPATASPRVVPAASSPRRVVTEAIPARRTSTDGELIFAMLGPVAAGRAPMWSGCNIHPAGQFGSHATFYLREMADVVAWAEILLTMPEGRPYAITRRTRRDGPLTGWACSATLDGWTVRLVALQKITLDEALAAVADMFWDDTPASAPIQLAIEGAAETPARAAESDAGAPAAVRVSSLPPAEAEAAVEEFAALLDGGDGTRPAPAGALAELSAIEAGLARVALAAGMPGLDVGTPVLFPDLSVRRAELGATADQSIRTVRRLIAGEVSGPAAREWTELADSMTTPVDLGNLIARTVNITDARG